jgi:hypothetical protein
MESRNLLNDKHLTLNLHTQAPDESGAERKERGMETTEMLVKTMESILEERVASQAKEKQAVESLNAVLQRMGYQIVPLHQDSRRRSKRSRGAEGAGPGVGAGLPGDAVPKRRGRPAKVKTSEEETVA